MYRPFIFYLVDDPQMFLARFIVVVFSICFHECLHARVSRRLGDDTAAANGYAGINPFRQMGVKSLLMLFFFGIVWGQTPVDYDKLQGKYAPAAVASAGVAGNVILAIFFVFAATLVGCFGNNENIPALEVLFFGGVINLVLAIINILPLPGLDGYEILSNLFPDIFKRAGKLGSGAVFLSFLLLKHIFRLADVAAIKMVSFFAQAIKWIS